MLCDQITPTAVRLYFALDCHPCLSQHLLFFFFLSPLVYFLSSDGLLYPILSAFSLSFVRFPLLSPFIPSFSVPGLISFIFFIMNPMGMGGPAEAPVSSSISSFAFFVPDHVPCRYHIFRPRFLNPATRSSLRWQLESPCYRVYAHRDFRCRWPRSAC